MQPISQDEMISEQAEDVIFNRYRMHSKHPYSPFIVKDNSLLLRICPVDGAEEAVVPESLQQKVLYLSHCPLLVGHLKGSNMYDSMGRKKYWSRMANDVFQTAKNCHPCSEAPGTSYKTQKPMKHFPASKLLEYIAMDLLGPFPPTENRSVNIFVITEHLFKSGPGDAAVVHRRPGSRKRLHR